MLNKMHINSTIFILLIGVCSSCDPSKEAENGETQLRDTDRSNLEMGVRVASGYKIKSIDSANCLDFEGEGAACNNFKVCPGDYYYNSILLLKHINSNLEENSKKIPSTCCRDFDTLSFEKEIYLMVICWGGYETETWISQKNDSGKFRTRKYGFNGIKLETKTEEVNDFLIHEHHKNKGAIMSFNKDIFEFDTLKVVSCNDLNNPKWICWQVE